MKLIITGKTQSGKTTAIRQLLVHLLRLPQFTKILLLDGKGHQLAPFAALPRCTFYGPHDLTAATEHLASLAEAVPDRYTQDNTDRYLIAADDIQVFTRAEKHGAGIKRSLNTLSEAGALGDYLLFTTPRETGNIPPPTRTQLEARLRLIGNGFFFYDALGQATQSGRFESISGEDAAMLAQVQIPEAPLPQPGDVPQILGYVGMAPTRAPATLYLGPPGAGKTYALNNHPNGHVERQLYVDLDQPHRACLSSIVAQSGAALPQKASIADLSEIAALAITTCPTLLLLDNLDKASPKSLPSVNRLIATATAVAMAANEPRTPAQRRKLEPYLTRCQLKELQPLNEVAAAELLWNTLDRNELEQPEKTEKQLLRAAAGNPGTVVSLARRVQKGDDAELRQLYAPIKRVNIGWIIVLAIIAAAMVSRRIVDSYLALAIVTMLALGLRPFMYRMIYRDD